MLIDSIFRVIFLLVFLTSVGISGFYRRRARQSGEVIPRSAEGSIILILRMALALIVAVSFFAYVFAPSWLSWSNWHLPLWIRILGASIAMLCIPAIRWVFVSIGNNISETILTKSTHQLVNGRVLIVGFGTPSTPSHSSSCLHWLSSQAIGSYSYFHASQSLYSGCLSYQKKKQT